MPKLALHGGTPVRVSAPVNFPIFDAADVAALETAAKNPLSHGEAARGAFERAYAQLFPLKHVFAVNNGTVSLEMILRALEIGRGDEVILPSYTFIATVSSVLFAGATPVFADIDPETYDLDPDSAEAKITPRTRAILPVYIGGRPADLDRFQALCQKHGLFLIEDAAQAVGALFRGKPVGSFGAAGSVSCQASKNLTCGEGGIVLSDSDAFAGRFAPFYHGEKGTGGALCEVSASILSAQLLKLPAQMALREKNAALLDARLSKLPFVQPMKQDERITRHGYHLYLFRLKPEALDGIDRALFLNALAAEGYPAAAGYSRPCHRSPVLSSDYAKKIAPTLDLSDDALPHTIYAAEQEGAWFSQTLLLSSSDEILRCADAFEKVYEARDELRGGTR